MRSIDLTKTAFHNRSEEWALLNPLVGSSCLELGNKKNGPFIYKQAFEALGFRHVSVDINGQDGALPYDLTHPLRLGQFDLVTNFGCSEHIEPQAPVWANMIDACAVGSVLISTTPLPGGEDWVWHGNHYPTFDFYESLARRNWFRIERLYIEFQRPKRMIFARFVRERLVPFAMPDDRLILYNEIAPRPVGV